MGEISVRTIILKENGILLIHRIKTDGENKLDYYVFPGRGLEQGEIYEECVAREVFEELGIKVKPIQKQYKATYNDKLELFYICQYIEGDFGTGSGPEFTSSEYSLKGMYLPEIIDINKIKEINLQPTEIRDKLAEDILAGRL